MVLTNVTEGAVRSTVLKVTQMKPRHRFVAWQALVDGCATKSSDDPAIALQPILATPKRCKDAKRLEGEAHGMIIESGWVRAPVQGGRCSAEDVRCDGKDAEGHHARVLDGTEEIRRNYENSWSNHQRNDGRPTTDQYQLIWTKSVRTMRERRRVTRT